MYPRTNMLDLLQTDGNMTTTIDSREWHRGRFGIDSNSFNFISFLIRPAFSCP
jgi:hypothetical protein